MARISITPSGGVDEFAVVSAGVELVGEAVALDAPACEFAGGRATLAALASDLSESADWPSDESVSAEVGAELPFFAFCARFAFRTDAGTLVEEDPLAFVFTVEPEVLCAGEVCFGVCVAELLFPLDGELARERKKEPLLCELPDRSDGDPDSGDGVAGETRAATGMPTLFIVMRHP